ncbi:MAG: HAMP domain-containing sensor histidine kinase [Vicinamibacterales bacterium]|nr:HAMP domain-containing sensor histidine kinase [Vicinamibacterales bacterium]
MAAWQLLHVLAWAVGLKAARDLQAETASRNSGWTLLVYGIWSCLVMELAAIGTGYLPGLDLLAAISGTGAAVLMGLAFRRLLQGAPAHAPAAITHHLRLLGGYALLGGATVAWAALAPGTAASARDAWAMLGGGAWLVVSLAAGYALWFPPDAAASEELADTRSLSIAFGFAFLHSALAPLAWIADLRIHPDAGAILGTSFVLLLVASLYRTLLHARSLRLTRTLVERHQMQEQLWRTERIATIGSLAASAAHDFRNALTVIVGRAELALEQPDLAPAVCDDLHEIQDAAQRAVSLSTNLLSLARRPSPPQNRNLSETVRAPLRALEWELKHQHITTHLDLAEVTGPDVDHDLIFHVMLNLYLNARDAMRPKGGGTLTVTLARTEDGVTIAVTDTGVGIPDEFQPRMFTPLETTKGPQGTGLGLSGARGIIESMGGAITFATVVGAGTTFRIRLPWPAAEPEGAASAGVPPPAPALTMFEGADARPRVVSPAAPSTPPPRPISAVRIPSLRP